MIRLGLFAAGVRLAEWLPPAVLYGLAHAVGLGLSLLPSAPRRHLRQNLAVVLGVAPGAPTLDRYVRSIYRAQTTNYVDLLRAQRITADEATSSASPDGEGWAAFRRAMAAHQGLILVTAHFGRFELMTHYLAHLGLRLTLPVERLEPPALFDLIRRLRERPSFTLVAADLGLRPCLRALQRGDAVTLFADWDSTGHGVLVRFFDRPARLPAGPALLAVRTGAPLFVGFTMPDPDTGGVRTLIEPPLPVRRSGDFDADVRDTSQLLATALQRRIRRYPQQWVLFHEIWPGSTAAAETAPPPTKMSTSSAPPASPPVASSSGVSR